MTLATALVTEDSLRVLHEDNAAYRTRIDGLIDAVGAVHAFTIQIEAERQTPLLNFLRTAKDFKAEYLVTMEELLQRNQVVTAEKVSSATLAAALILSHSHLDDMLNRLLAICVQEDWATWRPHVLKSSQRKYGLEDALLLDPEAEIEHAIKGYLVQNARLKIAKRNSLVLTALGNFGLSCDVKRASFDDLKLLDERRHALIHSNALLKERVTEEIAALCKRGLNHAENLILSAAEKYIPGIDITEIPELPLNGDEE